jgi:serine/threonine-protein kinase
MRLGTSLKRGRRSARARSARPREAPAEDRGWSVRERPALWAALVSVGGLGLGYVLATAALFPAPAPPGELLEVPDVRGRAADDAVGSLADARLEVGPLEYLRHPTADSGTVVGQAPLPGQLARPGAAARLTVSLGPERRTIPSVTGLRADRALDVLVSTGLQVRVDSVEDGRPRGQIVAVSPAEGTAISLPGDVRVTVSLGPATVTMPELLGLAVEAARDSLGMLGLQLAEVEEIFQFGRNQGRVVGQEPPAGAELDRGAEVRLVVGRRGGDEAPPVHAPEAASGGNNRPLRP